MRILSSFRRLCGGFGSHQRSEPENRADQRQAAMEESHHTLISSASVNRTIAHQPLHASVRPHLDPEYVAFHDKYVQYVEPEHEKPWDRSVRTRSTWPYAGSPILEVGKVQDIRPCGDFAIRVFSPTSLVCN